MTSTLPEPLSAALDIVASAAADLQDPWWIYGGAAMAMAGLDDLHVPDIDVLASPRDARRLIAALHGDVVADPGEGMFRSAVFAQILTTPVPVDVMADMDVRSAGEWTRLAFASRLPVATESGVVYIPGVAEQIATCRLFGRPKDLQRADRLEKLIR
jgi:hypothetical protein